MARLYADEDFPHPVVEALRRLGHDVQTMVETGRAGQGVCDAEVLLEAANDQRAVLTHNHADFMRLHRRGQAHQGIISCTHDPLDSAGLARRIHSAIENIQELKEHFVRIIRPNPMP